jgi:uncharacterized protein (TIGR03435 family)
MLRKTLRTIAFGLLTVGLMPAANGPEFDVASVKASPQETELIESHLPSLNVEGGRNLNFSNIALRNLIMLAYSVGAKQVSGPEWLTNRFDVIAKVPGDAKKEEIPLMLQALLAERFKLVLHREQKTMQVYALEVAKSGPKMQDVPQGATGEPGCTRSFAETPGATLAAACHRMNSSDIAAQIQALAPGYFRDGPIVDASGLKGIYNFRLEWVTQREAAEGSEGLSIFAAVQQQLGMKLEARKQPVEVLVIDHCEKTPTEN